MGCFKCTCTYPPPFSPISLFLCSFELDLNLTLHSTGKKKNPSLCSSPPSSALASRSQTLIAPFDLCESVCECECVCESVSVCERALKCIERKCTPHHTTKNVLIRRVCTITLSFIPTEFFNSGLSKVSTCLSV